MGVRKGKFIDASQRLISRTLAQETLRQQKRKPKKGK
jgi:hypothetical protein